MSRYTPEQKAESIARARELLAECDARDAEPAAEVTNMSTFEPPPGPSAMQSFGLLPLLSSEPMDRWRREAEELERTRRQGCQHHKAEERRIMRERQQAAERAARVEMTEEWTEVIGEVIAEEHQSMRDHVAEQIGLLRAELTVQRTAHAKGGEILDLPAVSSWRRKSSDAA
jgi:hypothetical protein